MNNKVLKTMNIMPRLFYQQPTTHVAQQLLGKIIIRSYNNIIMAGIINETEAYGGAADQASHAYKKKTDRNKAMFGPVGHSYVYLSYGIHHCLNIVAREKKVKAGGVLIRGVIPVHGIEIMQQLRNTNNINSLTNGPGKIGQAFNLNLADNHIDVTTSGPLHVIEGISLQASDVINTPRIGISKAHDRLWRFVIKKSSIAKIIT